MSILTGRLLPNEVLLASDTVARGQEGATHEGELLRHVTKCIALPHLRTIVGTRGHAGFAVFILAMMQNASIPSANFDGLLPKMRDLVSDAYDAAVIIVEGEHDMSNACEVAVFGWSDKHKRVIGAHLSNIVSVGGTLVLDEMQLPVTSGADFTVTPFGDGFFQMPGIPEPELSNAQRRLGRKPSSVEVIIEFAKAQRDAVARQGFPNAIGGRLILTTLNRNFITQKTIYTWPDFAETVEPAPDGDAA